MRRSAFPLLVLTLALLPTLTYAVDIADEDGDGVRDGLDNCPSVHNPGQENLITASSFFGDACNPDDDLDGIPDDVEDLLDYRDSRGGDGIMMGTNGIVFFHYNGTADSDNDGAIDLYEINTGTDPFAADTDFETINLIDYFPMGDISYTYQYLAADNGNLTYLENYSRNVEQLTDTTFKDSTTSLFGERQNTYSIGKYSLRLIASDEDEFALPGLTYIPYEMKEGSFIDFDTLAECETLDCSTHSLLMIDKGTMTFNGADHEYITLASTDNIGYVYYIYLKNIGLYGTAYMNLVNYEITSQVDVAAIAAALPEESGENEEQEEEQSSSSSSGGALDLTWLLMLAGMTLLPRRCLSA